MSDAPDWSTYRACTVCRAGIGEPCRTRSGVYVADLSPSKSAVVVVSTDRAHSTRRKRTGTPRRSCGSHRGPC